MNREHINRAHKAMGIVHKIQDFCDSQDPPWPYDNFMVAVKHPIRSESVKVLTPFCNHCREWPSRDTWYYVEEFLTTYEITKIAWINPLSPKRNVQPS